VTSRETPGKARIARWAARLVVAAMLLVPASAQAAVNPVLAGSVSDATTLPGVDSVAVAGSYAYVTDYAAGRLSAVDISLPSSPFVAGSSETSSELTNGDTVNIAGGYAFVVSKNRNGPKGSGSNDDGTGNSLTILDIHTNPAEPKIMGAVRDPNSPDSLFGAYGIAVSGNYAYVASQGCVTTNEQPCPDHSVGNSLDVIEIAGSGAPKIVATLRGGSEPQAWGHVTAVAISGSYAYLTAAYQSRLTVVNIANPLKPQLVTSLHDSTNFSFPVDVAISGSYAYVINQNGAGPLVAVDISNPKEPKVVGSLSSSPALAGGYRIRIRGNIAYVSASENAGIAAIDISNPLSPRLLASFTDPAHLHSTTGLDLDPTGRYVVATSTYLSGQHQPLYPPYALQPGGPELNGTVSVITLDPKAVEVTIAPASEPAGTTAQTSANFEFSVNDAVATVQCRLDNGPWSLCTTPTSQSYTQLSAGAHSFQIQATDSAGNTNTAAYSWTVTGTPTAPVNTSPPSVSGTATVGQLLSVSPGSWSGYPAPSFTYQWLRCNSVGQACTAISGATGTSYTLLSTDAGSTLAVTVKATNSSGAASADSTPTAVVTAPAGGGSGGGGSGGGGSGGSGGGVGEVLPIHETAPSTAQIQAALLGALLPSGKAGRIASVRKHHGYQVTFNAPAPGTVVISWYELPKGAHLASAKPVLVASGRATVTTKGTVRLTLKLTARGRSLLAHGGKVKLTARGTFTLAGASAVTVSKPFTLR
jgi:hypothetical protein